MKAIQSNNGGARVVTTSKHLFFRRSRAANSVVGGEMLPKFKVIQALMVSLLPVRMMKINSIMTAIE